MVNLFIFALSLLATNLALASESIHFLDLQSIDDCKIRVVIDNPDSQSVKADVLFFIGYGDRADNHSPLFSLLSQSGYRVISFDYPSHGETQCGSLNYHNYSSLMRIALEVEEKTRTSLTTPLVISGWSTGGLLAVRLAQTQAFHAREPQKMFLLAPGISVYSLVGGDGIIRQETLLSNPQPPHRGPIHPVSPLLTPFFSTALVTNSLLAQHSDLPPDLETFMIIGSDEDDLYAKSANLRVWYRQQKLKGSKINGLQCPESKHEIDNEIDPIGPTARTAILNFLESNSGPQSLLNFHICSPLH